MIKSSDLSYDKLKCEELTSLLCDIYENNRDMVVGILSLVIDEDDDVEKLLLYIKRGNNDWESVHRYAIDLYDKHEHDDADL